MLAADELSGHGLQIVESSLQHDYPKWKLIYPEARVRCMKLHEQTYR